MVQIHMRPKELEVAKIHYMMIHGLNISVCKKAKTYRNKRIFNSRFIKNTFKQLPQKNLDEK